MSKGFLVAISLMVAAEAFMTGARAQDAIKRSPDTSRNRTVLADTLGAMHYLTTACSGLKDQSWRALMAELLTLEQLSAYERDDLVSAFNHGYREEKYYYPECTAQSVSRIETQKRLMAEQGQLLSTALADPYLH